MTGSTYLRSRFSGDVYVDATMVDPYDEASSWQAAVQSYDVTVRLDGHREAIDSLIRDARWILDLEDDWDGEAAIGHTEGTLTRAAELLSQLAQCCWDYWSCALPLPAVNPADEGSIDFAWRGDVHVLINVPRDDAAPSTFAALGPEIELYGSVSSKTIPTLVDLLSNGG